MNHINHEETNEILVAIQNMLWYLESGELEEYEREKKYYESLKEKDRPSASLSE